jgi:hypothetical protein
VGLEGKFKACLMSRPIAFVVTWVRWADLMITTAPISVD